MSNEVVTSLVFYAFIINNNDIMLIMWKFVMIWNNNHNTGQCV